MGDTNSDYLNQSNNDTKHMKKIAHKLGFSHILRKQLEQLLILKLT